MSGKYDLPANALKAATEAYVDAWGWNDRKFADMGSLDQNLYSEKIQLAIEAFMEAVNE